MINIQYIGIEFHLVFFERSNATFSKSIVSDDGVTTAARQNAAYRLFQLNRSFVGFLNFIHNTYRMPEKETFLLDALHIFLYIQLCTRDFVSLTYHNYALFVRTSGRIILLDHMSAVLLGLPLLCIQYTYIMYTNIMYTGRPINTRINVIQIK